MGKKEHKAVCVFGAAYLLGQLHILEETLKTANTRTADIEPVHQLRVTSRRLRTGISHFRACLPDKKSREFDDEIRRLGSALGKARDLDTQIETLNALYDSDLDQKFKPGYRRLLLRLKQRRMKRQKKVEQALAELRETRVLSKMKKRLDEAAAGSDDLYLFTPSLYQRAFSAINTNLDDFLSYEKYIDRPEDSDQLHAMRIAGKHLRYALEIFAPVYKDALVPHIQFMKEIQGQLGRMHDDDVWIAWLPKFLQEEEARVNDYFGNTGPMKRLIPGLEHLIEDRTRSREKAYQSFLSTWETLTHEQAWQDLRDIIKAPLKIESAMKYLMQEEMKSAGAAVASPDIEKTDQAEETQNSVSDPPKQPTTRDQD